MAAVGDRGDGRWVVIVNCPSCRTRYRHRATEPGPLLQARCSRCEQLFPLVAARRSYVLLRSTPGIVSPAGMDDPSLAAQLAGATAGAADPFAMVHPEFADEAASFAESEPVDETSPARPGRRRRRLLDFLVAALLVSICTAGAYYGATARQFDPLRAAPAGSAVGLFLAWFWVRWAARKH